MEERIIQYAERKLYLDEIVNRDSLVAAGNSASSHEDEEDQVVLEKTDLLAALRFGADCVVGVSEWIGSALIFFFALSLVA